MLQKIHYEVDEVGSNVKIDSKNLKYKNVRIDQMPGKKLFILVNLKAVKDVHSLTFFDELGSRIEESEIDKFEKSYVLLAVIAKNDTNKKRNIDRHFRCAIGEQVVGKPNKE